LKKPIGRDTLVKVIDDAVRGTTVRWSNPPDRRLIS
jgi:hypothetical protein